MGRRTRSKDIGRRAYVLGHWARAQAQGACMYVCAYVCMCACIGECVYVCMYARMCVCVCPWPLPGSANRGGSETSVHRKQTGSMNAILAGRGRLFDAQVCASALAFPHAYGLIKNFYT